MANVRIVIYSVLPAYRKRKIDMKKLSLIILAVFMVLTLQGCGTDTTYEEGKLNIVTTLYASYDFANQVVGNKGHVTMLLSPGEESHSFDPTPKDIIRIAKCDLFIYNGGENEEWVEGVLEAAGGHVRTLKMMDVVNEVYEEEIVEGMQHEHEHDEHGHEEAHEEVDEHDEHEVEIDGHEDHEDAVSESSHEKDHEKDHGEYDEHVWTSLDNAMDIVHAIEKEVIEIDSKNADMYSKRAWEYCDELAKLRDDIKKTVDNGKRKYILFGDRFPMRYFTEEFGLCYSAAFPGCSADTDADAATIKYLIDKVNDENIPVIIKSEMSSGNIAETIASETGRKVLTMYACHNIAKEDYEAGIGYLELMQKNLEVLKEALY